MDNMDIRDLIGGNYIKCWEKQVSQVEAMRLDLRQFRKKEINPKYKVVAAGKWRCLDEICCDKGIFQYKKHVLKLLPSKVCTTFRSKLWIWDDEGEER